MAAKIQLKNGNIGNFGGIFSTFDSFVKIGLSELIDNSLETRDIMAKYPYSDIIKNLTAIYFSGGDAIKSKSGKNTRSTSTRYIECVLP